MQKTIWQNLTSIHDLKKLFYHSGNRGNISQHNKRQLWQIHSQNNTEQWKAKNLAKIWHKTRMPTLTTSIQHWNQNHSNQTGKRNKMYPYWKRRGKIATICRWHDTIYIYKENPKDSTQKLLDLISEFSKVSGYNINIQKSIAFLYNHNEISEKK